jgi:hypothetical protein
VKNAPPFENPKISLPDRKRTTRSRLFGHKIRCHIGQRYEVKKFVTTIRPAKASDLS